MRPYPPSIEVTPSLSMHWVWIMHTGGGGP